MSNDSELNPDHPVTEAAHDQWHKFLALVMHKHSIDHTVITLSDIELLGQDKDILVLSKKDCIHIRLMEHNDAVVFAAINGVEI